jgi:hypothetical protein
MVWTVLLRFGNGIGKKRGRSESFDYSAVYRVLT